MESLIRMRMLLDKLNDREYDQFLLSLTETFGKKQYISFIFGYFLQHFAKHDSHHKGVQKVVNLVSNIIELRKDVKGNITQNELTLHTESLKIDTLPNEMIRKCASYLHVSEYLIFSQCNRRIYIATNSPCAIAFFPATDFPDYHKCNLNRFPLIQHLDIDARSFNKYMKLYPNIKPFRNLSTLRLQYDQVNDHDEIKNIINSKCINLFQIERLQLEGCGGLEDEPYDFNSFCFLLKQFVNLQYLSLDDVGISECIYDDKLIEELLPNIKGFAVEDCCPNTRSLIDTLINKRAHQINSLMYDCCQMQETTQLIWSGKLPNLKELYIQDSSQQFLIGDLNSLQDIKRFNIRMYDDNNIDGLSSNIMCEILKKLNKMHHFAICVKYTLFGKIAEFLLNGLKCTKEIYRKQLRIVFVVVINRHMD
eukprot:3101_1